MFIPNRLNLLPRSRRIHEWPIDQLNSVGALDRDFTPYIGGMHDRLTIVLKNSEQLLFVVKDLEATIDKLLSIIASEAA